MNKKFMIAGIVVGTLLFTTGCSNSFTSTSSRPYEPVTVVSPEVGMTIAFIDPVNLGSTGNASTVTLIRIDQYNAKVRNYNEIITAGGYDPLEMSEARQAILNEREDISAHF